MYNKFQSNIVQMSFFSLPRILSSMLCYMLYYTSKEMDKLVNNISKVSDLETRELIQA